MQRLYLRVLFLKIKMHFAFIPYGEHRWLRYLIEEIEHQTFFLPAINHETGERRNLAVKGGIRQLPFGVYEIIFPKEALDIVLTTMKANLPEGDRYNIGLWKLALFRRMFKLDKIPTKFKSNEKLHWFFHTLEILPIGIREDREITETEGEYKGFTHEAL